MPPLPSSRPTRPPWAGGLILALAMGGVGLIGYGLWEESRPTSSGQSSVVGASPRAPRAENPPPMGMVTPGAGVYTHDAPSERSDAKTDAPCLGCDVILVTVCSLRKDHLGTFGDERGLSPTFDQVAETAFRFDRAYAASNFTLASLTAVLTGRFGSTTGVTGWDKGLTQDVPTLPEILGFYGYRTAGFTTDAPSGFRPDYGLDRGFQHMEISAPPRATPDGRFRGGEKEDPGAAASTLVKWLDEQDASQPLFAMFHTRTAHFPFVIDAPNPEEDPTGMRALLWNAGQRDAAARPSDIAMPGMAGGTEQQGIVEIVAADPLQVRVGELGQPAVQVWREAYAEAVQLMDSDLTVLWEALERRGRLDRTVVIVVADHGESLNDHGELLHGDAFFDGVINVPLVVRVPGMSAPPDPVGALVSQVDILPTVLDLVGASQPAGIDGKSLVPLMRNEVDSIRAIALSEGGVARQEGPDMPGAVIAAPWALLVQRRGCPDESRGQHARGSGSLPACLFHMDDDPDQTRNRASSNPEIVKGLMSRWTAFRDARSGDGTDLDLSPAFIQELQKSGYDFSKGAP